MRAFGFGAEVAARRRRDNSVPAAPAPALPAGFALNGAGNPALRAMLARVTGGTGRGRIVFKGDSTTVGTGAGTGTNPYHIAGARPFRPSAALAAELGAIGYPALDAAVVGDNGVTALAALPAYDPRVAMNGWTIASRQSVAGGGLLSAGTGALAFTPDTPVDTFELVIYRAGGGGSVTVAVDGVAPAAVARSGATGGAGNVITDAGGYGFCAAQVTVASTGLHTLTLVGDGNPFVLRSIRAHASGTPAVDILNHASNGATSANQAATEGTVHWNNGEALAYDAPDLTIVNLGLNDTYQGVNVADYAANLQAIVAQAKASGDVLLVHPHPADYEARPLATQQAFRDAAESVSQGAGISFVSLFDYFGAAFTPALQARMTDGLVHGDAGFYAEVGQVYRRCLQAMVA